MGATVGATAAGAAERDAGSAGGADKTRYLADPAAWRKNPRRQFRAMLKTEEFIQTGRAGNAGVSSFPLTGLGEASSTVYVAMFSKFLTWLTERARPVDFVSASAAEILPFFDAVSSTAHSEIRWRYLRLIERTYDCLVGCGAREDNPISPHIPALKKAKDLVGKDKDTGALADESRHRIEVELEKLRTSDAWKNHRDAALVAVMLGAGLKVSEALSLGRDDFVWGPSYLAVNVTKGVGLGNERKVRVQGFAVRFIKQWFESPIGGQDVLFPGSLNAGSRMDAATAYRRVRRILESAEIPGEDAMHFGGRVLRNAFAATLIAEGMSDDTARTALGLRELKSVGRYRRAATRLGLHEHHGSEAAAADANSTTALNQQGAEE